MTTHTCYLTRFSKDQLLRTLDEMLAGMNETGLREVVRCLTASMAQAAATGQPLDRLLETGTTSPAVQSLAHLHRHLAHHLVHEHRSRWGQPPAVVTN